MPSGLPIGTSRNNARIRTVQTESEMREIYDSLVVDATPLYLSSYNGQMYSLPNGGTVGWRYLVILVVQQSISIFQISLSIKYIYLRRFYVSQ
jgi:hypothetical protein